LRGVFLIQDGGSSHIASDTRKYFAEGGGWWRPRYTPANASWLNQAEILIHEFKHYYLRRASWRSQQEFKTHVSASWPEYNHRYAHPFEQGIRITARLDCCSELDSVKGVAVGLAWR
jgi:hypothetical protein